MMSTLKYLLLGLLILISFSQVLNSPGAGQLENFANFGAVTNIKQVPILDVLVRYPPGTYWVLKGINSYFQNAWVLDKLMLFLAYLLSWGAILIVSSWNKKDFKLSMIDVSIGFLASVALFYPTLSLGFFEILAAPFFILAVGLLFRKFYLVSGFVYLLAVSFNWSLLVLAPLFWLYVVRNQKRLVPLIAHALFLVIPALIALILLAKLFSGTPGLAVTMPTKMFNFSIFMTLPVSFVMEAQSYVPVKLAYLGGFVLGVITLLTVVLSFGYLANQLKLQRSGLVLLIATVGLVLGLFILGGKSAVGFMILFLVIYLTLLYRLVKVTSFKPLTFVISGMFLYLSYLLFAPDVGLGNLMWLAFFSLLIYLLTSSTWSLWQLILVNLLVFINFFIQFGGSGQIPVRSVVFVFLHTIFAICYFVFALKLMTFFMDRRFEIDNRVTRAQELVTFLKRLAIVVLILLNISLIPAEGTEDMVSFADTARIFTSTSNPLAAYVKDKEMYPPVSSFIIGAFANGWKFFLGTSDDYRQAIKLSVFTFYILSLLAFIKLAKASISRFQLSIQDILLVSLTTLALIIQTQGFADVNVFMVPTLILSILAIFNRRYWWSGFLLALTAVIKWQPLILLPIYLATLIDFQDILASVKRVGRFLGGLVLPIIILLVLVLIQPNGDQAVYRTMDYMFNLSGFHLLSGQAMNLNWIVTYLLHILAPDKFHSLDYYSYLNHQIASSDGPFLFRGLLFDIVALAISVGYLLFRKKNIVNFLYACLMIFFSHHMIDKSAHEKHLFFSVIFMLLIYLLRPTRQNRYLLILFDVMAVMNLIFFYGFTGASNMNRLFFGFDITVLFAAYYLVIYIWFLRRYALKSF